MNRYQPQTPRLAFAVIAVVLSLVTMIVLVGAPTLLDTGSATVVATSVKPATEVTLSPARIDVVGTRESVLADEQEPTVVVADDATSLHAR